MANSRGGAVVFTLFLASVPAGATVTGNPPRRVSVRILEGTLIVVPVTLNGAGPYPFLLDTGATFTVLDETLAATLGLPRAGTVLQETATTSRPADLVRVSLAVGGVELKAASVISRPLDAVRDVDSKLRGVLGQDFLRLANWWLDYRGRALIEDSGATFVAAALGERVVLRWYAGRPIVEASSPAGAPLRLVLDSAATAAVLFREAPGDPGERLGLATLATHNSDTTVRMVAVGPLRFGQVEIPRLHAGILASAAASRPAEDGLLPTGVFEGLYFDNRAGTVVLNPRRSSLSGVR